MANILDIRRRIRSVINTRQITRAMKMISAARLRRAQERALAARPYAQMLTNVLKSLVSRADIYDSATGEILHPLLVKRDEQNVLLIVITCDKGLAGAFNANILKAASKFIDAKSGKNIELETIGRKGRDFLRRRFAAAGPRKADSTASPQTTLVGEQIGVLNKVDYPLAAELADRLVERYANAEIDSVYIVYNEFKSVIAQRLVVEKLLPLMKIGIPQITGAVEPTAEEKERAAEAALSAGIEIEPVDTAEADEEARKFGTANVDYIYEQPAEELFAGLIPQYVFSMLYHAMAESVAAEQGARMTAKD